MTKKTTLPLAREFAEITREFIEENQNPRKIGVLRKGGPYSKKDRTLRRNEVFNLHFEYGYSAIKIAEMMKINRHTINGDISYWYSKLSKEWKDHDVDSWYMKQIHRLEIQRTRLIENLEKEPSIENKLAIEKVILDIDNKIIQGVARIDTSCKSAMKNFVEERVSELEKKLEL